jgi:hypothetical protein
MALPAPDLHAWDAWRPADLARLLAGVRAPWWVAGGWALDLWRGAETRPHGDLEICVPRAGWAEVRSRLAGYEVWAVGDGEVRFLEPGAPPPGDPRQMWVHDRAAGAWRVDVMLDPGGREEWVCHRDARLRRPLAEATAVTPEGVRYLRPEIVLLLKAKHRRPKDEADLAGCLPLLDPGARRWLRDALSLLHPDHAWRSRV